MVFRCKKCGKFLFEVKSPNKITSVEVAKMFGKKHKNVLRDIALLTEPKSTLSKNFGRLNFELSSYKNTQNKKLPCYTMTRAGFRVLAARYKATRLRTSPDSPVEPMETAEIKDSRQYTKIYGSDRIEVVCGRCGTVNVF